MNRGRGISRGRRSFGGTILIMIAFVAFAWIQKMSRKSTNPVTGTTEYVKLNPEQEIALGLQSRDQLAQQFGGYYPDKQVQNEVTRIGNKIVAHSDAAGSPYQFNFHVLNDPNTVNAFALPGGQVFITTALLNQLKTEDQLAGVLGHEIGHVIERHSSERMADEDFWRTIGTGVGVATGDYNAQQMASQVINSTLMANGRKDEYESDDLGVKYMMQAGYDPSEMIAVMDVLEKASGGSSQPEFASTHPNPGNRKVKIKEAIQKYKSSY